jgi:glycosyltransferase involved in cell wall biosynthesis
MHVAIEMVSAGTGFAPAAGGMTTYYEGLSAHLPDVAGVSHVTALMPAAVQHARIAAGPRLDVVSLDGVSEGRFGRVAYEHLRLPRRVAETGADVLLATHNVKPLGWRGRCVVVLQSMQYFFLPDEIGAVRRAYLKAVVPRSLRNADRVIAVSEAARADAISLFGLAPERIVAVHHGCSPWATEAAAAFARDGVPPAPAPLGERPYIAIVSSLYGLKNHPRLVEAFALAIKRTGAPHGLAIAGREHDVTHAMLAQVAERHGIADRLRLLGPYPQDDLPALIANADAIAYPSLYETFGHPVLEAFAFGRPLLTSNVGGAAEVAADAAVLVDPRDTNSIADGLARLLSDAELRSRLAAAGAARLSDFSWRRCAEGTAAVLSEALD